MGIQDAGTGKSTLMNGFSRAISRCGYKVKTFRSVNDRFGGSDYITADLAIKDDMVTKSLKNLLSSEEAKTLITGGEIVAEEKFMKAEQLRPKCVILANSNHWSHNFSYEIDSGISARFKILSTYRMYEIFNTSKGVDRRPYSHLPKLAKSLGVDQEALYLWALRIAADKFWSLIKDSQEVCEENLLENEVNYWTSRLRITFKDNSTSSFTYALAVSQFLRNPDLPNLQEGCLSAIVQSLQDFYFIGVDPSACFLHEKMKEQWTKLRRPSDHYYMAFREIRWESIKKALTWYITHNEDNSTNTRATGDILKELIGKIHLRDGFKLSSGFSYFLDSWNSLLPIEEEIKNEAEYLRGMLSENQRKKLESKSAANDRWMEENPYYSPHIAHKLREKEWNKEK